MTEVCPQNEFSLPAEDTIVFVWRLHTPPAPLSIPCLQMKALPVKWEVQPRI